MRKQVEWRGKMYQMPSAGEWDIRSGFLSDEWINYGVATRRDTDTMTSIPGWGGWGDDDTAAMSVNMDTVSPVLHRVVFDEVLPYYMDEWFDMYDANVYPIEVLDALIARLREIIDALERADWDKIPTYLYQDEEEGSVRPEPVMGLGYAGAFRYEPRPEGTETLEDLLYGGEFRREWKSASEEEQWAFTAATSGIAQMLYQTFLDKFEAIRRAHPEAWYFVIYGV